MIRPPPRSPLFPYTTLFRSVVFPADLHLVLIRASIRHLLSPSSSDSSLDLRLALHYSRPRGASTLHGVTVARRLLRSRSRRRKEDRKSTRLNSSHANISYAV